MELVTNVAAETDLHPAANVQLDAPESIVVAIPGQAAEEFALNTVPDNAIQIVDDEPQGVPTEEEVDAMLAATATALLTSGLAGEVISGDDVVAPPVLGRDRCHAVRGSLRGISCRGRAAEPAEAQAELSQFVAQVEPQIVEAGPAFELSPPPLFAPVSEEPTAEMESVAEPPLGTPLFSEQAMLAAAPAPELVRSGCRARACRAGARRVDIRRAGVGRTRDVDPVPMDEAFIEDVHSSTSRPARRLSSNRLWRAQS